MEWSLTYLLLQVFAGVLGGHAAAIAAPNGFFYVSLTRELSE